MHSPRYKPRLGDIVHLGVGSKTCLPAIVTKVHATHAVNLVSFMDVEDFYLKPGLDPVAAAGAHVPYYVPAPEKIHPFSWHYASECPFS